VTDDDQGDEWALKPGETVCPTCRLAGNKHLTECGNCWVGRSVHDREGRR